MVLHPRLTAVCLLLGCVVASSVCAAAAGVGAINSSFNTSARFAGMGETGVGAPWGQDTNHWANPAALAYRDGLQVRYFRSQLARGLADDIVLTNLELIGGDHGLTFLLATGPGLGNRLDLGEQIRVDEDNNEIGSSDSWMRTKSFGVAVDPIRALDRFLASRNPGWAPVSKGLSVSGGAVHHRYEDELGTDFVTQDSMGGGSADASFNSFGYQVRLDPLGMLPLLPFDVFDTPADGFFGNGYLDFCLGVGYGESVINRTDDFLERAGVTQEDPLPRAYLSGWSWHGSISLAENFRARLGEGSEWSIVDFIDPLVSFTYNEQTIEPGVVWTGDGYGYEHDTSGDFDEQGDGWELGLANILFVRRGHVTVEYGDIDGDTEGWGLHVPLGRFGGFRYDQAEVPQAQGLPNVTRHGGTVWIDALVLKQWLR